MPINKIAIIGRGNAGTSFTAYLINRGLNASMYTSNESTKQKYSSSDFHLSLPGTNDPILLRPLQVSDDLNKTISDADLILVTTPADGHAKVAIDLASSNALKDNQIIVLNPGRTGGVLEFRTLLSKNGVTANLIIAEAQTLLFACRKYEKEDFIDVIISGIKSDVAVSAFPVAKTQSVVNLLNECFGDGCFIAEENYLKTTLMNVGAIFHPTPLLLNFARFDVLLEKGSDNVVRKKPNSFYYYREGISPATADFLEKIDQERMDVAKAYGIDSPSVKDWLTTSYKTARLSNAENASPVEHELYFMLQDTAAYESIKAPQGINQRYITEDVPTGLVPISELAKIANVPTPCINSVIALASALYGKDFRYHGRNLINLGLNELPLYKDHLDKQSDEDSSLTRAQANIRKLLQHINNLQ